MNNVVKPVARTIRMVGEKAIGSYLGATDKLAGKIISKVGNAKGASRSRRQVR